MITRRCPITKRAQMFCAALTAAVMSVGGRRRGAGGFPFHAATGVGTLNAAKFVPALAREEWARK